ncbi:MAG: hypothetical protein RL186_1081 [Pseudomonadota bacterium]|jgi:2-dehydro-3-deoxygalactonokinase
MSLENRPFIGINWGSSNFRAYLIGPDGAKLDEVSRPCGVLGLSRDDMEAQIGLTTQQWPLAHKIYASGMIGSNVGWVEAPYVHCPTSVNALSLQLTKTRMAGHDVEIVPGLTCEDEAGQPDILRGEELELFGLLMSQPDAIRTDCRTILLPGTHSKWVSMRGSSIESFFTSMAGELFDRVSEKGILASIIDGPAKAGPWFSRGLAEAWSSGRSLVTLLFQARSLVMRHKMAKSDAASFLRGLLIGAELGDAKARLAQFDETTIEMVGNPVVASLYQSALQEMGATSLVVPSDTACLAGFAALHRASFQVEPN